MQREHNRPPPMTTGACHSRNDPASSTASAAANSSTTLTVAAWPLHVISSGETSVSDIPGHSAVQLRIVGLTNIHRTPMESAMIPSIATMAAPASIVKTATLTASDMYLGSIGRSHSNQRHGQRERGVQGPLNRTSDHRI